MAINYPRTERDLQDHFFLFKEKVKNQNNFVKTTWNRSSQQGVSTHRH